MQWPSGTTAGDMLRVRFSCQVCTLCVRVWAPFTYCCGRLWNFPETRTLTAHLSVVCFFFVRMPKTSSVSIVASVFKRSQAIGDCCGGLRHSSGGTRASPARNFSGLWRALGAVSKRSLSPVRGRESLWWCAWHEGMGRGSNKNTTGNNITNAGCSGAGSASRISSSIRSSGRSCSGIGSCRRIRR